MSKLAIKGHPTRGKEVIEILEMLGGENEYKLKGCNIECAYYNKNGVIHNTSTVVFNNIKLFPLEEFLEKFPYKVGDSVSSKYLKNYKIGKAEWESCNNRVIYKLQGMGWYSVEELQPYKEETMEEKLMPKIDFNDYCKDKYLLDLGNYEIKEENGKTYAVRKRLEYPKTYKECCVVLSLGEDGRLYTKGYKANLIQEFQQLLICRDAYWKIAGEEMGVGKPWKPDWNNVCDKYTIYVVYGKEIWRDEGQTINTILAFPTAEMRDAFYENFKELIEKCRELL